jgi:hypothetical protein
MQILHILSYILDICIYSFKYLQILRIGVITMNHKTALTLPSGKSATKKTAGLSLPILPLFETSGNTFIYYNESPFIQKLKRIKFKFVRFVQPLHFVINLGRFPKIVRHNGMSASVSHSTHQLSFNF